MSSENYEVDREMMIDFIDESMESLGAIPSLFIELEANPSNLEVIEAMFRPIHSLKGNAAYFGLLKTKHLAHEMESVLDMLRKSTLEPTHEIVDQLLVGVDTIIDILDRTRHEGGEMVDEAAYERVLGNTGRIATEAVTLQQEVVCEKTENFKAALLLLEQVSGAEALAGTPERERLLEAIGYLRLSGDLDIRPREQPTQVQASGPLHTFRTLIDAPPEGMTPEARGDEIRLTLQLMRETAQSEQTQARVDQALEEFELFMQSVGLDSILLDVLRDALVDLEGMQDWSMDGAPLVQEVPPAAEIVQPEKPEPAPQATAKSVEVHYRSGDGGPAERSKEPARTMRVSETSIDRFLGYVGEFIAVDEMFRYIHSQLADRMQDDLLPDDLLRVINTFTKLSDDLQHSIMDIRKIPVRAMLQKTQRIVRDLAAETGKRIEVHLSGEDLMVDRSLVETLEAPLVHMVRNAADHGIETAANRLAAGKPEVGGISIKISQTEDHILLEVRDDGRGLNLEAIQAKAVAMGQIAEGERLSRDTLVNFIFNSGFSTAERVTEISGRGVGMDAVKREIEDAGGKIEIQTEAGVGTSFHIKLPKTVGTQIINSFVVRIGEQRLLLPIDRVSGSFRPKREICVRMPDDSVSVRYQDEVLPVMCLSGRYFGEPSRILGGLLIRVDMPPQSFVFYVDAILGMQKVVLRKIPWIYHGKFKGAAIMGDGHASLIIDLATMRDIMVQNRVA